MRVGAKKCILLDVKHLKPQDYLITPWKNGQGSTSQMSIYPNGSTLSAGDFDWRLSTAEISSDGDFSIFPQFERLLLIWQGSGMHLNKKLLPPFVVHSFKGDEKIHAELVREKVKDLGLIYDPKKVKATFSVLESPTTLTLGSGQHFFFAAEGSFKMKEHRLHAGECLQMDTAVLVDFQEQKEPFKVVLVSIFQLS